MAVPTFAFHRWSSDDISIRNYARVSNDIEVEATTGDNEIEGFGIRGGRISTGTATAYGTLKNDVNYNEIGCDCTDGDLTVRNTARVRNELEVKAESGDNEIEGFMVGGGRIRTGTAYADGLVENFVNTNVVGE